MTKLVDDALKKAKDLEKQHVPSREEIVSVYKEGLEEAEKLKKLLKPTWFVRDTDAKTTVSPSRKKKHL